MVILLIFLLIILVLHYKFEQKITGQTENNGTKDVEITVSLKYQKKLKKNKKFGEHLKYL